MDNIDKRLDHIDNKLDSISVKLDNHLERLSKAEEAIHWMKGHIKIVTAVGLGITTSLITLLIKAIIH